MHSGSQLAISTLGLMHDSHSFTYEFEYIGKNYGNDRYDIETATMDVSVDWSEAQEGYVISYNVPDEHKIDPAEGNSDMDGFYEHDIYWRLMSDLARLGIGPELVAL